MIDRYLKALSSDNVNDRMNAIAPIVDYMAENDLILTLVGNVYDLIERNDFESSEVEGLENAWEIRNGNFVAYPL